ncbi:alpha/beta fold hydrolase [Lapillicoccus sp.]|uniref:alpha/beta fold hydrolase n=1 Tax=Lapillicoccus sp. TaxID=1909287 RepID=UPI003265B51B
MAEQEIRFTTARGRRVAWSAVGSGPTLVVGGWWCSHLELDWEDAAFRWFIGQLGTRFRVVRYDRPGTGLSDRDGPPLSTLDDDVEVLDAVIQATGEDSVLVLGASSGGCVAARYVASHPGRVRRLVLYGTYADGRRLAPEAAQRSLESVVGSHWGIGSRVLADVFLPGAGTAEREAFARFQRLSATAENAAASLAAVYGMDVRDDLSRVSVPTQVLHRRDDHAIAASLGRDVAARIPGATFVLLDGVDHFPWRGDAGSLVVAVSRFLGESGGPVAPGTEQATLPADLASLTGRELEVLRLVATGLTDDDIAEGLVLSPHTVHRHVANIRTKLGLASRAAAAAAAARAGLV